MSTEETPSPTPATDQAPSEAPAPAPTKLTPRSGPIVTGTLVLVFCAYVVVQTLGGRVDATTWAIATILGLGALLLLVGIAVLARGSRPKGR